MESAGQPCRRQTTDAIQGLSTVRDVFSLAAISLSTSTYAQRARPVCRWRRCDKIRLLETGCDVYVRVYVVRPTDHPGDEAATSSPTQRRKKRQRLRRRRETGWKSRTDADDEERWISDRPATTENDY